MALAGDLTLEDAVLYMLYSNMWTCLI